MKQINSILLYVDAELNPAALNRVVEIADSAGAKLTLGTVVKPARSQVMFARDDFDLDEVERLLVEDRQRQLEEAASSVSNVDVEIATRVFIGDPTDAIIQAVQNKDFDFLMKLPSPSLGLRQQLFGSIDMRLMRACPCPVLIRQMQPDGFSGHAVAAVDYDEGNETKAGLNQAILDSVALVLAEDFSVVSEVHIVHAWSLYGETLLASGRAKLPPDRFQAVLQQEEARRKQWLDDLVDNYWKTLDEAASARFNPKVSLLRGDPQVVIPQKVKELGADVLAMGTVSRGGISGMLMGNTAEALLSRVDCSVITLKPEGFVSPVRPQ